jgi:preprotein translocase SecE subunit
VAKSRQKVDKKQESVRDKSTRIQQKKKAPRRLKTTADQVSKPLKAVSNAGKRHYNLPIPIPKNKAGEWLSKPRHLVPKFFRNAWAELRQVVWPNRKETIRMTIAVFIFAIIFGASIYGVDIILEKIFREILIN